MISNFKRRVLITGLVFGILSPAAHLSADTLKVGLAAEPTSVDPHYHNLTINNSMATQVFDIRFGGSNGNGGFSSRSPTL